MQCPKCDEPKTTVSETRRFEGQTYRRRRCAACETCFVSVELTSPNMDFPQGLKDEIWARVRNTRTKPITVKLKALPW